MKILQDLRHMSSPHHILQCYLERSLLPTDWCEIIMIHSLLCDLMQSWLWSKLLHITKTWCYHLMSYTRISCCIWCCHCSSLYTWTIVLIAMTYGSWKTRWAGPWIHLRSGSGTLIAIDESNLYDNNLIIRVRVYTVLLRHYDCTKRRKDLRQGLELGNFRPSTCD